jgi:hypothetical protein
MPAAPKTKPRAARIILGVVGLLLALYGTLIPLLPLIGARAAGEITVIRRELGDRQDPVANRYSYSVGYEFALPDGRIIPGNTKVIGSAVSAGISKGSSPVFYLPALPYVNALERDTRFDLGKVAILAAGVFLCFAAVTRRTK